MTGNRLWEIDFLRGLAVLAMVVSNFLFDLYFFLGLPALSPDGWPGVLARLTAGTFILLVGVSLSLSYARRKSRGEGFAHYFKRGCGLILLGMVVSVATWFTAGKQLVIFGVLHLIGTSILLSYPLLRFGTLNTVFGLAVILAARLLGRITVTFPWLIPLGLAPRTFKSVDYAPLFPWWGLVLIGIGLGSILYRNGSRRFSLPFLGSSPFVIGLGLAGRHSLIVYFAHQPLLLGALWLYMKYLHS